MKRLLSSPIAHIVLRFVPVVVNLLLINLRLYIAQWQVIGFGFSIQNEGLR